MSYILDALKKSEREREHGAIPSLRASPQLVFERRSVWIGIGVGVTVLGLLAATAWYTSSHWRQPSPAAAPETAGPAESAKTSQAAETAARPAAATAGEGPVSVDNPEQLDPDTRAKIEGLSVNVVSYSEVPKRRFVMLNQRIVRESDTIADGVVVKRILPGAALLQVGEYEIVVRPD